MRIFIEGEESKKSRYSRTHVPSISSVAGKIGLRNETDISRVRPITLSNISRTVHLYLCASTREIESS